MTVHEYVLRYSYKYIRDAYLKDLKEGAKYSVKTDIKIHEYSYEKNDKKMLNLGNRDINLDNEHLLKKFALYPSFISPGVWALLQSTDKKSLEIVVMFNIVDR